MDLHPTHVPCVVKIVVTAATDITLGEPAVSKLNMSVGAVVSLFKSLPHYSLKTPYILICLLWCPVPFFQNCKTSGPSSLCFKMEGLLTSVSSRVKVTRRLHAGASTSLLLKLVAAGE